MYYLMHYFPEIALAFFEKRKNHVANPKVEHKEVEKAAPKEITKPQQTINNHEIMEASL